jgi:hypothetical protein
LHSVALRIEKGAPLGARLIFVTMLN